MGYDFVRTELDGVFLIKNHTFCDERGKYEKHFEMSTFKENGIDFNITESSDLYTKKGAIRGLHYQNGDSQAKLIRVVSGKVFDVVVDLRKDSTTFGKKLSVILDVNDNIGLFIPRGFAHGFLALEESIFAYHCDGIYEAEKCGGLRYDDPYLSIDWPLEEFGITNLIITEKDKNWPLMKIIEE